ncbi:MAG: MBL fold metallo-hydrolase [Thermoplasmatales archaeon]|nr:MBL fold metallo-hydrolase [Thermoplasmatales archaeon]
MARIVFLGTGGGRHTAMFQARSTGGMVLEDSGTRINVDPGPGALTNMMRIGFSPYATDAVVVTHCHPDHYSDAEVLVEGMCRGGMRRRGALCGSVTVLDGGHGYVSCLSPYHQRLPQERHVLTPGDSVTIGGIRMDATESDHGDPTTVGLRFHTSGGVVSFVGDTGYSDEIARQHVGSRVLVLPVTTPDDERIHHHLCTEDAVEFVKIVKPDLAVFVHLGLLMLSVGPDEQARGVEESTGVRCVAGEDLMEITLGNSISISTMPVRGGGWNRDWVF